MFALPRTLTQQTVLRMRLAVSPLRGDMPRMAASAEPAARPRNRTRGVDAEGKGLVMLMGVVALSFLCVALPLPVIPLYITDRLELGSFWAGLGVGAAFLSTIVTRGWAGRMSDQEGARRAVRIGLVLFTAAALLGAFAGALTFSPPLSLGVLLAGRLLLGLGESLAGVGSIAWGIALVGPTSSGRVLAMVGASMYAALAVGGPIGLFIFDHIGFEGTMLISAALPVIGSVVVTKIPAVAPQADAKRNNTSFFRVLGSIWRPGAVQCLQGIGFAGISAFFVLYFREQGWGSAGLGFTAFGAGFVLVRMLFGHLPDRIGGVKVAIVSLAVESVGQGLIWYAPGPTLALVGAFATGLGSSLLFPAMGREVVQMVSSKQRGAALGGFAAFQDIAYGLTGPLAGLLADDAGYGVVFGIGTVAAVLGLLVAISMRLAPPKPAPTPA